MEVRRVILVPRRMRISSTLWGTVGFLSQRVHVGIWYILRAQRASEIPTIRPKYKPYSNMDPWSLGVQEQSIEGLVPVLGFWVIVIIVQVLGKSVIIWHLNP